MGISGESPLNDQYWKLVHTWLVGLEKLWRLRGFLLAAAILAFFASQLLMSAEAEYSPPEKSDTTTYNGQTSSSSR